jgi:predicted phage terminase large subunit-like protein
MADLIPENLQIEMVAARRHLRFFIEKAFGIVTPGTQFSRNWHIDLLSEYLEACYNRQIKRLIINVPPRSLKSVSVSVAFPAWCLGHDPTLRFMCASYSEKLSFDLSMDTRRVMVDPWYKLCFPKTIIADDQNEKSKFSTTAQGYRIATSVGGRATGMGGNMLVVDDATSPEEAMSETIMDSHLRWFDNTWTSRLNNKNEDVMIVVGQRLKMFDLPGHLMRQGGWESLVLPAIFESTKTFTMGTVTKTVHPGELLHPDRFSKKFLDNERLKSSFGFAGQYMQNPVPEGGGIIKYDWFELWPANKALPRFSFVVQVWDTAFTEKTTGDPSGCCTFGVFFPDEGGKDSIRKEGSGFVVMLIDCFCEHLGFPDLRAKMIEMRSYRYGDQEKAVDMILVEDKASGQSILQELKNAGLPMKAFKPGRMDKTARLHSVSHFIENGMVYIPESTINPGKVRDWAQDFIEQVCSFPVAQHDEFVDCLSSCLITLSSMSFLRLEEMAEDIDEPDGSDPYASNNLTNPYGN